LIYPFGAVFGLDACWSLLCFDYFVYRLKDNPTPELADPQTMGARAGRECVIKNKDEHKRHLGIRVWTDSDAEVRFTGTWNCQTVLEHGILNPCAWLQRKNISKLNCLSASA